VVCPSARGVAWMRRYVFKDKYYMSITMVFGSMFAGATSEGGAAIAFPVMTLAFNVNPQVARDFSFMIQSVRPIF
jgi:uncharacterized protein